jgi:hypothetical protein
MSVRPNKRNIIGTAKSQSSLRCFAVKSRRCRDHNFGGERRWLARIDSAHTGPRSTSGRVRERRAAMLSPTCRPPLSQPQCAQGQGGGHRNECRRSQTGEAGVTENHPGQRRPQRRRKRGCRIEQSNALPPCGRSEPHRQRIGAHCKQRPDELDQRKADQHQPANPANIRKAADGEGRQQAVGQDKCKKWSHAKVG